MNREYQAIEVLKFLLSGDVITEDTILEEFSINSGELEERFSILESLGYLEVDNGYFERDCTGCGSGKSCAKPSYTPCHKVKKIRVITSKALEEFSK